MNSRRATYRVQLHAGFTFADAADIAGYLAELGVSDLYTSPCFTASPGSTHGYDVLDPASLNPELGGQEGHRQLTQALRAAGLGRLLDIVPNHMAINSPRNRWWWDVLENGPSSLYASYFDVDWNSPDARLQNVVLLPILGDHYGRALESGQIQLGREGAGFLVRYFDQVMPVASESLEGLLAAAAERSGSQELAGIARSHGRLPLAIPGDRPAARARQQRVRTLRRQLGRLLASPRLAGSPTQGGRPPAGPTPTSPPGPLSVHGEGEAEGGYETTVAAALDAVVDSINADADALDRLLERQNYRLAYWRAAGEELDYRRFFDVSTLAGLRAEDPAVFEGTHELILRLRREGAVDGLRVDHVDGLREPEEYLRRLRAASRTPWIVVEKITGRGEGLPPTWPVAGTTGYDFLNLVLGLFLDPSSEVRLTEFYAGFTGESVDWPEIVRAKKIQVLQDILAADVNRLTAIFAEVCRRHRRFRDYTQTELKQALLAALACFPVYRTYVSAHDDAVSDQDVVYVQQALGEAAEREPGVDKELFEFLGEILLLRHRGGPEDELAMRVQQLSGPVMAKGVEDTAFYNFNRFIALNEVGGDPGSFGIAPGEFHEANRRTLERWPETLLATSTHDTKRSEDVRARLAVFSEIPERWTAAVSSWSEMNERFRCDPWPDRNVEYHFYQTLAGAWPLTAERAVQYMEKAAREAKVHTSWLNPNEGYEAALQNFVEGALASRPFTDELEALVAEMAPYGLVNSLAQTLLKLTAPGLPDIYQGTELWDFSLVDPDNRRPVDYELRRELLRDARGATPEQALTRTEDGLTKIWLIRNVLGFRRANPALFSGDAGYEPLAASGKGADHVVAFVRAGTVAVVVPRFLLSLGGDWGDTALDLPAGRWRSVLTGDAIASPAAVAEVLGRFPVALLQRECDAE
ncbi:MAG: malto-oligosyltrehalose synthase [Dehalococcoidia bacterium]